MPTQGLVICGMADLQVPHYLLDDPEFASFLRARIEDLGISMQDVAERLGTNPEAVRGWASGRRRPRAEYAWALCEVLDVSPADLVWILRSRDPVVLCAQYPDAVDADDPAEVE